MANRFGNSRQPFETIADKVTDPATREALDRVQQFLAGLLLSRFDGDHFEISITRNSVSLPTTFSYAHNFKFIPKDVWITYQSLTNANRVWIDHSLTDGSNVVFNISNMAGGSTNTIRFFAGTFTEKV